MTSTRDRAVSIFHSLIKDPYYQGSKDKSREEVVWIESQQRARQANNNEIALSMALSDSSGAVKALLRHLVKASSLMTIDEYRALDEEDENRLKFEAFMAPGGQYWDLEEEDQLKYRLAVGIERTGPMGRKAATEDILDILEEYPDSGIPTTEDFGEEFRDDASTKEVAEAPPALSDLPKEDQLALFDGDEDKLQEALEVEGTQQQRKRWAAQPTASIPQYGTPARAPLTEEEQKERDEAQVEALRNVPRMAQESEREVVEPMGKTHTTSTGKGIVLSGWGIKPEQFLDSEQHATELQDMQTASDSFGIPIPGRTAKAKRLFVPVRLLNSISTGGHKRYPFASFMKKLEDDLAEASKSVGAFGEGRLHTPQYLLGKREGAVIHGSYSGDARDEIGFRNYIEDMQSRTTRMPDGTDWKLSDSPIGERLKKVEELAALFSSDISKNRSKLFENAGQGLSPEANAARLDRVRKTVVGDYNKRLREYGLALENLQETMSDNMHFDVDDKDTSATRTHVFSPELSAELMRLEFLEDASQALGKSSVTPFSDFMTSFRFSTDEYDDEEKKNHGDSTEGQHWDNDELADSLLNNRILPSLKGQLPKQLIDLLYTPKGEIQDIEQWNPTVVSPNTDNPDGYLYTAIENLLTSKRDDAEKVTSEARGAPKRLSKAGKLRAQLNQLYRVSKGLPAIEGMGRMARIGKTIQEQGMEFDEGSFIDWEVEDWKKHLNRQDLQEDIREEEGEVEGRSTQQAAINDKFTDDGTAIVDEDDEGDTGVEAPENVEEIADEELKERLGQNFQAFYDAIMADESGREGNNPSLQDAFIGDDKALFRNDAGELEWKFKEFGSDSDKHLEIMNDLIQNILLPRNVPEGSDDEYTPDFTFYGPAADSAFRRSGRIIPTNATIIRNLKAEVAKSLGIAEEDMSDSEELSEFMQKFNNQAPGVDMSYKDLLLDKNSKSNLADPDMTMGKFLSDVAMPLIEEANTPTSLLNEDELQEHIANSQAMSQFWQNVERGGGNAEPPVRLASDIAVAMHPALVSAAQSLGGNTRLEEDAIEQLPEYAEFENALRQMISPRTTSKPSKKQYDAIIPRFARKLLQITSASDYDSDNPDDIQWHDPLNDEVPPPILDTIRTIISNPAYGVAALLPKDPSLSDLLQGQMSKTGGYTEWAAQNEEAISFFNDLLGPDIFTTWAGQKKFRKLLEDLPATKLVKNSGQFGIDSNGTIGLDVIPNLFELLKIPATVEEWEAPNHKTVTGATRWGGQSPYEELQTETRTKKAFEKFTEPGMQRVVNHFYNSRHPNFYPIDITRLGTPQNAFEKAKQRISETAFRGLGSGIEGSDKLAEMLRDTVGTLELNRPFNARGYPLTRNSPANLDDYVSKVLDVLYQTRTMIEDGGVDGEPHPLAELLTPSGRGKQRGEQGGDLLRRIADIENNYIHAEGEDSWRNQFHSQYWEAWDKDEIGAESDPELHKHIYNMWSGRQQDYDVSTRLNSIFSMEKVLSDRGYDVQTKEGNLSAEQKVWMEDILQKVSQSFSDMSKNVNNVSQGFDPDQQRVDADVFGSQQAPFVVDQAMNQLELRGHLIERAGLEDYTNFDTLFPDNVREDKPIVPKRVLDWFKSSKNYGDGETPSEEHADKIPMLAEEATGDPEDKENYLKPHPDHEMHPAVKRTLTNFPWHHPTNPIEEARKLFTQRWDNRDANKGGQRYLDVGEEDETGEASTVVDDLIAETENWQTYAPDYNPFQSAPSRRSASSVGPINHAELYDHIANRTPTRPGREMIHPHEEDYNHTDMPNLGIRASSKFNDAGMLDEQGNYLPEVHAYMNTLPKTRHETQANHMVPESMADNYIQGFQNGFKPIQTPEPGIEGQDLNKAINLPGGTGPTPTPQVEGDRQNQILQAHPMFLHADTYDTINNCFRAGENNEIDFDAFNEWVQKHGMPIHPSSEPNTQRIELPFIHLEPRMVRNQPSLDGGRLGVININPGALRDIGEGHGGNVENKKAVLARLYKAQADHAGRKASGPVAARRVSEADRPQWDANIDYKMGINQQWINMLENQLISSADIDPDDEDAVQDFLSSIEPRKAYTASPTRDANAFNGYMHRWAAEHGLPSDDIDEGLYNPQAMKDFLANELKDGKGNPLHYIDNDGNERFRFRSFAFNKDALRGHFVANHERLFGEHGLDPDALAQQEVEKFNNNQVEQIGRQPEPIPTPTPTGGPRIVESTGGPTPTRTEGTGATIDDPDRIEPSTEDVVTEGTGTADVGPGRTVDVETGELGGHKRDKVKDLLLERGVPEAEINNTMSSLSESAVDKYWMQYVDSFQKPKPEAQAPAVMNDETKQKYIDTVRTHSHEMHGTDIHGDDKFDDMSDKQIKDAYDASHKEVSTHRAKQAASGKQNYANDIVTRLSALPDGAPEDKILNQARSLTSEFLKHRTIFDKPALSHWQTMMQDLKAKATAAGVDWEPLISNEINQYQDGFGSPEHLTEVNETKRQQQQQQADYVGKLDARYAQAQQHPEYRPGHFVRFIENRGGGVSTQGFDYNNPVNRDYDASEMDELGEPPMFEDARGNKGYGMYHPHSESWINPFVYEQARKNMLDKNKNPHLSSTSVIRNGRQWTNTHKYDDDVDIEEKHAFAIPTQKKQAELEQRNQNQMGYMIGTDGNIVGLDSDWNNVLDSRDMNQEQSPSRIVQDYHIRQLQQQHEQNPEYIGTRREAPIVTPKSPQAQQAQARSQQPPQQAGTAVERFAQRQAGTPSAKPYSFNPQDFMTDHEKNMQDIGGFFSDSAGAAGRSLFRGLRGQNPFQHTPGIEDYWKDRTKEYEQQNKINELYHTMHTQYFGTKPDKPFYGSDEWSKQRASNEALGYDTTGQGQGQYGPQPDQLQSQTPPAYEEQSQPKPQPQPQEVGDALSRLR